MELLRFLICSFGSDKLLHMMCDDAFVFSGYRASCMANSGSLNCVNSVENSCTSVYDDEVKMLHRFSLTRFWEKCLYNVNDNPS